MQMQAKIIKMICGYRDIALSDLAAKLHKSTSNFYQIIKRDDFRESELQEIADALGCDLRITFIDRETGREF